MAQFIQKFANRRDYEASEHQYPNVSLIEDEGLVYTMESPEPDVLLNASKIKWNVTDGSTQKTSEDSPSISVDDTRTLINALNDPKDYNVTATANYHFNDEKAGVVYDYTDVEVSWFLDVTGHPTFQFVPDTENPEDIIKICFVDVYRDSDIARIFVSKMTHSTATWEINYTIENAL